MSPPGDRPDVLFVHHGAPRVYDQVHAIVRAGYTCRYVAGYFYRENGAVERLIAALPLGLGARMLGRLRRRSGAPIDPSTVDRSLWQDVLMLAEQRLRRLFPDVIQVRSRYIDRRAARLVRRYRPRIVIVCDTHARRTLRAARSVGAIAILDQVIGHITAANRIMAEEAALHPELKSAWRAAPASQVRDAFEEIAAADHILAPSAYVRDTLIAAGAEPERISLLPYGADLAMFSRDGEPAPPPFRILFAGHVGLRKGVVYLLEAVRRAGLEDAETVLLGGVEGDGAWLEAWQGRFTHIRHLPHAEIPAVFASAHVYVYPSLHEGSTVSIYEAMATGLPVIATPNSGSMVRDGLDGFIVPIRDVDALAERLVRLHDDPGLRARMSASARRRAADFTWDAYGRRLSAILGRLLSNPDDPRAP